MNRTDGEPGIGLPDLQAEDYWSTDEPLAVSLSSLMKSTTGSRVKRKFQALERLSVASLDEARIHLLMEVVDKYLPLTEAETIEMNQILGVRSSLEYFFAHMTSWEEKAWTGAKRDLVIRLLRRKFGDLKETTVEQLASINDPALLDDIAERLISASTIADLGFV